MLGADALIGAGRDRVFARRCSNIAHAAISKPAGQCTCPRCILDWDIAQIKGAFIKCKNPGMPLLPEAIRHGYQIHAIESRFITVGKDERALSVSGHVYHGFVKYIDLPFNEVADYKPKRRGHLLDHSETSRIGEKHDRHEDDQPGTVCCGMAMALGNTHGSQLSSNRKVPQANCLQWHLSHGTSSVRDRATNHGKWLRAPSAS